MLTTTTMPPQIAPHALRHGPSMLSARLTDIELVGKVEKKRHYFVVVYVDDEEVAESESIYGVAPLRWQEDHVLEFRPSSTIKFEVFRHSLLIFRRLRKIGHVACNVTRLLENDNTVIRLDLTEEDNNNHTHLSGLIVKLSLLTDAPDYIMRGVDADLGRLNDGMLVSAPGHIDDERAIAPSSSDAAKLIRFGVEPLGQVLKIFVTDNFADVHPIVKVSWAAILAIYMTVRGQIISDKAIIGLIVSLRKMVGVAAEFQDPQKIKGTADVIEEVCRASLQVASLIDEYMRPPVQSQIMDDMKSRIDQCEKNCRDLIERLDLGTRVDLNNAVSKHDVAQEGSSALKDDALAQKISVWLNAPDSSKGYNDARKKHPDATGSYFLDGAKFSEWKKIGGRFLCIYGMPGSGKTVLASSIVTNVADICKENESRALAYFFYKKDAQFGPQTHDALIRSLIRQFIDQRGGISALLADLYGTGHNQPSTDALEGVLRHLICRFNDSYIIIDALDECTERRQLLTWICKTASLKLENLHLLVTSQAEEDIKADLQDFEPVSILMEDMHVWYINSPEGQYFTPLVEACKEGDMERVQIWLEHGTDANVHDGVALQVASREGHLGVVKILLEHGANVNAHNGMALCSASKGGHVEVVRILLEPETNGNAHSGAVLQDASGGSQIGVDANAIFDVALQNALEGGHAEVVRILMEHGANVNAALQDASAEGQIRVVKMLLDLHADVNMSDGAALQNESKGGHVKVVRILLDHHVDVNAGHDNALVSASENGHIEVVQMLLSHGANVRARDDTILVYASKRGHVEIVKILLDYGANINARNGAALCKASKGGHVDVVRVLVERRAEINVDDGAALQYASKGGHAAVVQILLDSGADINAGNGAALQHASKGGYIDVVRILLTHDTKNVGGSEALCYASERGHVEIVRILLDHGVDVDAKDGEALWSSSERGHVEVVKMLLDHGAKVNTRGDDILWSASERGYVEIVRMLLENKISININAGNGAALRNASAEGHIEVVKLLLEHKADVNGRHSDALVNASGGGHVEVVRELLSHGANINTREGGALRFVSGEGYVEIVKMLSEHGIRVNINIPP